MPADSLQKQGPGPGGSPASLCRAARASPGRARPAGLFQALVLPSASAVIVIAVSKAAPSSHHGVHGPL